MKNYDAKKWFLTSITSLVGLLLGAAIIMILVDPYFHYHKPFSFLSYRLYEERYINDGISRHFDFDAVITGTSMSQNFKPSEMDALFGTNSIKASFSGAGFQEISQNLERTLNRNDSVHTVLLVLDYNGLLREYDYQAYPDYPTYLYDNNPFNDVSYLFNKSIFYHGVLSNLAMTLTGTPSTTMDEYSSWERENGLHAVLYTHHRDKLTPKGPPEFTAADRECVTKTMTENYIKIIRNNPDVTFYIYYPPFSICYWEAIILEGLFDKQLAAEQIATELLLEYPNVKLYSFFDQYDTICNLDNYSDTCHHKAEVNSQILEWIAADTGRITKENYLGKLETEKEFFLNYDYDSIYKDID